jgi:hypothetical protein
VVLPSGDVVTNHHVFKTGFRHSVARGGKAVLATVKAGDPKKDLCILSAPGLSATPVRLGQASRLKVGEPVYAVGAPQGLELSLSEGIVSQLRGGQPPIIQTTVAISQGSSGGGLFNAEGELVGIMTFYVEGGQSLNFAVPVEWVSKMADSPKPGQTAKEFNPDDWVPVVPESGKKSKGGWADRADLFYKTQDWHGLLGHSRQWTQAEPDNDHAWFALSCAYEKLGRYSEAISACVEILRLIPHFPEIWAQIGNFNIKMGRWREAIEPYREALRLKPNLTNAWGGLAFAYAMSGNRAAALQAVKELRRYDPQMADKVFNIIMKL